MSKCELIYDLLPNYLNGLTSPLTNELIEEHLNNCTHCRDIYEMMNKDIEMHIFKEKKGIDFLGKIRKSYLIKLAVSMISIIILMIGLIYLTNEKTIPISSEHVILQEVYELKDGRIFYKLEIEGADELTYLAEGTGVLSTEELGKDTQESYYFVSLKNTVWNSIFHSPKNSRRTEWGIIDLKQELSNGSSIETYGKILIRDVKKAYYEGKDENDRLLIWEEGMKIPSAPENIEGLFK